MGWFTVLLFLKKLGEPSQLVLCQLTTGNHKRRVKQMSSLLLVRIFSTGSRRRKWNLPVYGLLCIVLPLWHWWIQIGDNSFTPCTRWNPWHDGLPGGQKCTRYEGLGSSGFLNCHIAFLIRFSQTNFIRPKRNQNVSVGKTCHYLDESLWNRRYDVQVRESLVIGILYKLPIRSIYQFVLWLALI